MALGKHLGAKSGVAGGLAENLLLFQAALGIVKGDTAEGGKVPK
jgi:hypothetical protein